MAITYGTGTAGLYAWRLMVKVNTVPRPLTARGTSVPSQSGQVPRGGCTQRSHAAHHKIRSCRLAPPVQNGRLASVMGGGVRCTVVSVTTAG